MKISEALQIQKALTEEIAHKRRLESEKGWSYVMRETPDAEYKPNFDFEKNHELIKKLSRLHTKLGRAIAETNLTVDIKGVTEEEFSDWV